MSQTNGNPIFSSRKESGYSPKLLNIDLSIGSIDTGYVKESAARKFLGGAGLAAKIVWEETTAETDERREKGASSGPLRIRSVNGLQETERHCGAQCRCC
jgi:hypothetical protein